MTSTTLNLNLIDSDGLEICLTNIQTDHGRQGQTYVTMNLGTTPNAVLVLTIRLYADDI